MCTGTVNGVQVCVKCVQSDNSTAGKTETVNPDGSKVETSTSTTTTVNNNNVTTTTTTTVVTTPVGGGTPTTQTKTDTASESKDSFCTKNPNDPVCKKSLDNQASGGDDCTAPPTCSGDAIQCMMVQQQWRSRCDPQKVNPMSDLAGQILAGNDPAAASNPASPGNRQTLSLANAIDQSSFLAGGGLQDKTFFVNGKGIVFPFSRLNEYLTMIGNAFVAISLIGAARIVVGVK